MKKNTNIFRILAITALIAVVWFTAAGCGGDDEDPIEPGQEAFPGATLGEETLSVDGQQVYLETINWDTGAVSYSEYTGADFAVGDVGYPNYIIPLGYGAVTGGKFSYTQAAAPSGSELESLKDMDLFAGQNPVVVTPNDAKGAYISYWGSDGYNRGNVSITNYDAGAETGTFTTQQQVLFIYVDKDAAITRARFEETDGDETYIENAVSLSLSRGWNAVTSAATETATATAYTGTVSITNGDSGCRWALSEY